MSGGDGLFEVDTAAVAEPQTAPTVPVTKTFRVFAPDRMMLLPPSLDQWLPQDHLARFIAELVDEVLDLAPILTACTEKRGFPSYDPRLMVRLLIYGYTTGVRSSRAIERRCVDDVAFRYLAAEAARPMDKAQVNFTDPDSRIMKNSDGAYVQACNAQTVVDGAHQITTAADVTTNPSDVLNYTKMLDQSAANTGIHPKQALADAGYCSEANLAARIEVQEFINIARTILEDDARARERAADEVTDHVTVYTPAQASALATLLAAAAVSEKENAALEAELHALLALMSTGHVRSDDVSPLHEITLDDLPPQLRGYVSDLLEE